MNLAFSTHWKKEMPEHLAGKPTYFIDKIWRGIISDYDVFEFGKYFDDYKEKFNKAFEEHPLGYNKLHTIRKDSGNRWKAGKKIHFVINNRTKNRFQFAPVIKCLSVQQIKIEWSNNEPDILYSYGLKIKKKYVRVIINGSVVLQRDNIKKLAINDGFDSVEDFFEWFNEDFEGKIIHWTNLKY